MKVNLIRNSDGEINFQEFTEQDEDQSIDIKDVVSVAPEGPPPGKAKKKTKEVNFGKMLIRSIHVTDGTFVFTDQTFVV